jgi:type IV pilus assembly protein PilA
MIQAIQKRMDREEKGFTLIELMVVVLIIAILIAIAVPTFLGARKKAQARAAQSNARNAYSAAKTFFTDNEKFSTDATSGTATSIINELTNIEPSLSYGTAVSATDPKVVMVEVADTVGTVVVNGVVCLSVQGSDGVVYTLRDVSTGTNAGVKYRSGSAAPACDTAAAGWNSKW